jgi:O-glycosyl hydrolase
VLGVYGREGLFAASVWLMSSTNTFLYAGFATYRNYDGNGATFGDTSIAATTSAVDATSVYASVFAQNPTNVVVVAINKTTGTNVASLTLTHPTQLTTADVYTLSSASAAPVKGAALAAVSPNAFSYSMPARSVSTLVLRP